MRGRVYVSVSEAGAPAGAGVVLEVVDLPRLESPGRLKGRYVEVRNGGLLPAGGGAPGCRRISSAEPDGNGDYLFEPECGGPRMDRPDIPEERVRAYVQAAHFAEVNTYYHVDRIGQYIQGLLDELGAGSLPPVVAVVSAHNGCVNAGGVVDGVLRPGGWRPMQGGHYRLPGAAHDVAEREPVAATGEIHLGSGQRLLHAGALARRAGRPYRQNAGHNAGIIYHEYGHHVHRHTADFRANNLRPSAEQSNRKVSIDEGLCDYWAAVMLDTPHIWAWHRGHDAGVHRRNLTSGKTMADYDDSDDADPHGNGTIWAACLWDFRTRLAGAEAGGALDGARLADKIVLQALLLIGAIGRADRPATCRERSSFRTLPLKLLEADRMLTGGRWRQTLAEVVDARGLGAGRRTEVRR